MTVFFLKKVLNVVNYTSVKEKKKLLKNFLQQSTLVNQKGEKKGSSQERFYLVQESGEEEP